MMVSGDKWTATQKERMKLVFECYPDMEEAYSLVHSIRMIFSNPRATWISGYESIQKWYEKVKAFGNDAFNTAADTIRDREDELLNYFLNRATNASAESLNSKIKQFRAQLRGVIDVDFFLYRLSMIYGETLGFTGEPKSDLKRQIVWVKQKTIENKSLPLWNITISMEDINRLKVVLVEKKRTARWLSMQMGVNPSTVSKWCTNSSQPDVASLLKIADLLEVDIKELLVREYEQFLLSKIKN